MDFNYQSVQRLGFDEYCTNLAVNLMEDGNLKDGYSFENDKYSVSVKSVENKHTITIRAYVTNMGWQSTEIVL
jgi:hypothetical protein